MSKVAMALEILSDGEWHKTDEMRQSLNLSDNKFQELTSFLVTYNFVKVDKENERLRVNSDFKKLLAQIT